MDCLSVGSATLMVVDCALVVMRGQAKRKRDAEVAMMQPNQVAS
jgi:hypothetical protein